MSDHSGNVEVGPSVRSRGELSLTKRIGLVLRRSVRVVRTPLDYLDSLGGHMLFSPRPDDIYIASYPRSGTTWLQMIVYQVMTEGSMSFEHIAQVVPYFERSLKLGRNLDALPSPRIFKTHLRNSRLPKSGRYIYVHRDPKDVLVSYYHFHVSHLKYKGSLCEFYQRFLSGEVGGGSWFSHRQDWLKSTTSKACFSLSYEDLIANLPLCVQRIARFCQRDLTSDKLAEIVHKSTFEFMKAHESKFDYINEILWERGMTQGAFIRQGCVGTWKHELSQDQAERIDRLSDDLNNMMTVEGLHNQRGFVYDSKNSFTRIEG